MATQYYIYFFFYLSLSHSLCSPLLHSAFLFCVLTGVHCKENNLVLYFLIHPHRLRFRLCLFPVPLSYLLFFVIITFSSHSWSCSILSSNFILFFLLLFVFVLLFVLSLCFAVTLFSRSFSFPYSCSSTSSSISNFFLISFSSQNLPFLNLLPFLSCRYPSST